MLLTADSYQVAANASDASVLSTIRELTDHQIPNLLRLYLSPDVAKCCLVLNSVAQRWCRSDSESHVFPSLFSNSLEEALSAAIKLARYTLQAKEEHAAPPTTLIFDPDRRFPFFAGLSDAIGQRRCLIPGIHLAHDEQTFKQLRQTESVGILVDARKQPGPLEDIEQPMLTIRCVPVDGLKVSSVDQTDILISDESWGNHQVPWAAVTASGTIMSPWMQSANSMFHSTTFQPNSLTHRHILSWLRRRFPRELQQFDEAFQLCDCSISARRKHLADLYSPSLVKLSVLTGFDAPGLSARGHFVSVNGQAVFDGVAGVACSLRGHNPPDIADEIDLTLIRTDSKGRLSPQLREELVTEISSASGLADMVPAVSGAAAVEHALQMALTLNPDRPHVIVFRGGFGGKTLGALVATERSKYKQHLQPLYSNVTYVDPFAVDAVDQLRAVMRQHRVGVVQAELIQGVGGVRPLPHSVIDWLRMVANSDETTLIIDEIQTGLFRTGPFLRCADVDVHPDLVTIGKGLSDSVFPFSATLLSKRMSEQVRQVAPDYTEHLWRRYGYPEAVAIAVNTLRRATDDDWSERVRNQSKLMDEGLQPLRKSRNVNDVRVFGMLIGIELNQRRWLHRLAGKQTARAYSLAMLQRPANPVLIGFCQYEPHIFKMTPGLLMTDDQIDAVTRCVCEILRRSPATVLLDAARHIWQVSKKENQR